MIKKLLVFLTFVFAFNSIAAENTLEASSETKSYADLQAELDQLKAVYTELEKISDAEKTKCGSKLTSADMINCATEELQQRIKHL